MSGCSLWLCQQIGGYRIRSQIRSSLTASATPQTRKRPPHRYNGWFLGVLCAAFATQFVLFWLPLSVPEASVNLLYSIIFILYFAVLVCILVADWHDFLTLHGHVNWWSMSWLGRFGMVVVYAILWITIVLYPAVYLGFAVRDTFSEWRKRPFQRKLKTAQMEAELGLTPPTEGQCRNCGKPLQVGAEYCQYCGAPALIKPRVCPACATVAQPDAKFCPKCRASLVSP